ncbi:probable E3 ubiquitin-protein ligase HERC4 [Selaginella moellendorffii]|uniref:probable E3 ubiquitin-protein ligase HERC4 n=1 Tax=Selaginella moellendorffii TaxID=88036 RepID=UPI000D1D0204|nr:probable E3 ubiquitin-protein ligase HERC4 [Selaginella moellendorffii]|eukprot:XP_002985532.2 probable E3 ubiquitin-protein ligase HERC4 [Selaginella moellendorffii]
MEQVYAWGRGDFGQLGVGELPRQCSTFVWISSLAHKDVVHIAASDYHTAFLTDEGELYTTGSNDSGQLGTKSFGCEFSPVRVSSLDTSLVSHVATGQGHTVAVTDTGSLVSWGCGEFGQLGLKDAAGVFNSPLPRFLRGSRELLFVRVACGSSHTLALTGSGDVYSFGQGTFGALGHGTTESCSSPVIVDSLWGLGIVQIACGDNHSCALTVEGQLFSWGRGKYGQLGCGSVENHLQPVPVTALSDRLLTQVVCGADYTMAIDSDGQLFSWGHGHWGQTGHGTQDNILVPKLVCSLENDNIVQASAGARHAVALTSGGGVYAWGDNEQGQVLPGGSSIVQLTPLLLNLSQISSKQVVYVVAGGEHTLVAFDCDDKQSSTLIDLQGDEKKMHKLDKHGAGLRALKLPCLHILFQETRNKAALLHSLESVFSSPKFLIMSFKSHSACWCGTREDDSFSPDAPETELNISYIQNVYHKILELYDPDVVQRLGASIIRLLDSIEKHIDNAPESRWLRALLIILQCPLVGEKGLGDIISVKLFTLFTQVSSSGERIMEEYLKGYPKEVFGGRFVRGVQNFIVNRNDLLNGRGPVPVDISAALKVLSILHTVNEKEKLVHLSEFYNSAVSQDADLQAEYLKWLHVQYKMQPLICYCQVPFILSAEAKSRILQVEANIQKQHIVQASMIEHMLGNASASPFLVLQVRRTSLVQDSLHQLSLHHYELKKPLMVIFEGESGVDQGGVTKEFFQLLVRDLFNVGYGMFTYSEESRYFWFNSNSIETDLEFQLVGIILGLAIYNGVILDVHFPLVVYKKLLGIDPRLQDLRDLQPQVYRSLNSLLAMEEIESMDLYFEVSYDCFGETKTHELIPNGSSVQVTGENKQRYVDLYVNYLLETSIATQFSAFKRGFLQVCGGPALRLFQYEELELLICGLRHYDFDALERGTTYKGGYTKDSNVIQWFWNLVKEMSVEEKKQLLFFTTGNDRAPVGGLGSLKLIIQRNGDDTERLPTAHTCFNILLLPEYSSQEKLADRLKLAISNSTGFGLQ